MKTTGDSIFIQDSVVIFKRRPVTILERSSIMNERSQRILNSITNSQLSYGDLSKLTGIPKSALQRYATGETEKVPIDRIESIAKSTGVTSAYLMGWNDEFSDESAILSVKVAKSADLKKLVSYYESLSDIGKKKALEYIADMSELYSKDKGE